MDTPIGHETVRMDAPAAQLVRHDEGELFVMSLQRWKWSFCWTAQHVSMAWYFGLSPLSTASIVSTIVVQLSATTLILRLLKLCCTAATMDCWATMSSWLIQRLLKLCSRQLKCCWAASTIVLNWWSYRTFYMLATVKMLLSSIDDCAQLIVSNCLSSPPLCDCLLTNFIFTTFVRLFVDQLSAMTLLKSLFWLWFCDCILLATLKLLLYSSDDCAQLIVSNSFSSSTFYFTILEQFLIIYPRFCRVLITRPFLWRRILNNGPYLMVLTCALNFGSFIITNPKPHDPSLLNNSQMLTRQCSYWSDCRSVAECLPFFALFYC